MDIFALLIALAPSILGGICSFFGGYLAARHTAKTQILTTAQTSFIEAKLNAFRDFETAFEKWSVDKTRLSCANMYHHGNAICLVANNETCVCVFRLLDLIRKFETTGIEINFDEISSIHAELLMAMKNDLLSYPVPKAIKQ